MLLNKKGITLIEIIISIALISIVLIFLFTLLVQVNDMNDESEVNSTYLINKSLVLKNIETDLSKYNEISLSMTNNSNGPNICIDEFYNAYKGYVTDLDADLKANECLKIKFGDNDFAYLAIYYYQNKDNYVISYIHKNVKATRELPEFKNNNVLNNNIRNTFRFNNETTIQTVASRFYKIEVPIFGPDGKDYSIIIPFYGKVSTI